MSGKGFFHSYFYGSSGKRDFTEADLPANRLQLFRDVLGVRRGSMVGLNFLYLLIWIPAIIWTFMNLILFYQIDVSDMPVFLQKASSVLSSYLLVLFPLIAITGPFNMGVSFVMRNWARDEHSFVLADFKSALKENWKQGLIYSGISGAVPMLVYVGLRFYLGMASASPVFYLPLAVILISAMLWHLVSPLLPTMIVTYNLGFFDHLRNALLMTMAALPVSIGMRLATLIIPILLLIILMLFPAALGWALGIALVLYAVFMLSFNKLICASHANALCEKYLNTKIKGARTNIGLRPEHETEETK